MGERILVVDDDAAIVRLVCLNLEMEGYETASASNGRDALSAVTEFEPDLVVCDVMMPVMDGLEAVSRLRRDPATASLPVVMLSAKAQDIDIRHGSGAGATEYMTKPFDPVDLVTTIRRVLDASKGARSDASKGVRSDASKRAGSGASKAAGDGAVKRTGGRAAKPASRATPARPTRKTKR